MVEFIAANPTMIAAVLAAGIAAGFAGGLFGIGGGIITVPALYAVFQTLEIGDGPSLKTAIGTSLGVIIITSIRSLTTHHRAGHVDGEMLRAWAPWIALGAAAGGVAAKWAPTELLTLVFASGAFYVAWRRLFKSGGVTARHDLMHTRVKIPVGIGTGFFSSLMGLGGGAVGVMVMTASGRAIHQAIATAAGFGVAVAAPGVLGFILSGQGETGLPPGSMGFFNAPAFVAMALMAGIAAPLGALTAHRVHGKILSRLFGAYVAIAAVGLLWDVFTA
jgi:uncharacterized membrane protein YfcA